ncbi:MAG: sialidase, partial [Gemmatimonadetes bacterium]|nr:sialidase [Gemmatimonadota bacterium]
MHLRRLSVSTLAIAGVVLVSAMPGMAQPAPMPSSSLAAGATDALRYRHVGPVGNRVSAVAGVPGDANVYWVGAASGGIWKSVDGGHSWRSVFDDHGVQSIGALAVAPSDPDVVWAGTGEPFIRSNVSHGAGVFRSDDGGESWRLVGLERTGRVARVIVHPEDPNTAWVAALGHLYGPQEERGVFRTRDGGATWDRVLFTDDRTGASDLWMDPSDPDHLIAGMWTMHIRTWGRWSGGPGSGLFETRDGGTTWARIEGRGLPEGTVGKVGLAGT